MLISNFSIYTLETRIQNFKQHLLRKGTSAKSIDELIHLKLITGDHFL